MKYGKRFHGIKSQKYGLICGNVCINLPDIKRECNTNNQSFCGVWGESYLERSAINSGSNPHSLLTISVELFGPARSEYVCRPFPVCIKSVQGCSEFNSQLTAHSSQLIPPRRISTFTLFLSKNYNLLCEPLHWTACNSLAGQFYINCLVKVQAYILHFICLVTISSAEIKENVLFRY